MKVPLDGMSGMMWREGWVFVDRVAREKRREMLTLWKGERCYKERDVCM